MRVSALQFELAYKNYSENKEKIRKLIQKTVENDHPDVIALPEMWNVSFFPDNVLELADEKGKETKEFLSTLAKENNVTIIGGSVATKEGDQLFNISYSFNRKGECIHEYKKVHLFSPSNENELFTPGDKLGIFEIDGHKVGVVTCYDLRFVEWIRKMALEEIEILFVPAAWPHPRISHWQTLLKARAIENQIFVAGVNSCGETDKLSFCGGSLLLNPLGEVLDEAEEQEKILVADFDLSSRKEIKESINVFQDRRPDLY